MPTINLQFHTGPFGPNGVCVQFPLRAENFSDERLVAATKAFGALYERRSFTLDALHESAGRAGLRVTALGRGCGAVILVNWM